MIYMQPQNDPKRQQTLMQELAFEGARRCGYHHTPETWIKGPCDCKYLGFRGVPAGPSSEQTGCCEIRIAYDLLAREASVQSWREKAAVQS